MPRDVGRGAIISYAGEQTTLKCLEDVVHNWFNFLLLRTLGPFPMKLGSIKYYPKAVIFTTHHPVNTKYGATSVLLPV